MRARLTARLVASSALIVGAGGLGSPAALALAASGVGRIGLIDDDEVDLSNLARQILHSTGDVGRPKVDSGRERLLALAPGVRVETHALRARPGNIREIIAEYGVIVDGSDNLPTKLMLNDACVLEGKPLVTGGILRFFGQFMTILPGETACYRCVFGRVPFGREGPSCAEAGVFGAIAGVIGMAQAGEAVRLLAGQCPAWAGRLMTADLWRGKFGAISLKKDLECPVCGVSASITSLAEENYGPRGAENIENELIGSS
jgi:adenylyltransferase/sulfurtransferase